MQQRLRITFARGEELKYVSLLDMMRLWQRALRRAEIPLAYSEGYTPRPRLSLASAMPVGVTGEAELLDAFLKRRMSPFYFAQMVSPQLPAGLVIKDVQEVVLGLPSLQSQVTQAEYRVTVESAWTEREATEAISKLLALKSLPWEHKRLEDVRKYDLRALVHTIWLESCTNGSLVLGMLLKSDSSGSGRPEQVTAALGIPTPPLSILRTKLVLNDSHEPAAALAKAN